MPKFKCDVCGKTAIINFQHNWVVWNITKNGEFEKIKEWNAEENEFYCEKCAEREGII